MWMLWKKNLISQGHTSSLGRSWCAIVIYRRSRKTSIMWKMDSKTSLMYRQNLKHPQNYSSLFVFLLFSHILNIF
ncbi:hypothetical protein AB205_0077120 [Aquarana catesbeiana]|uniref:Uncharacterized protein n=1 Tax=Aquarana catesbeiana TaxID=8400 RepID=A0A2G9S4M1_AQUCT|nr:hypothetical protein AB205_0077120 [Aquarana catesbeiana]